jgi:hypothetical protein
VSSADALRVVGVPGVDGLAEGGDDGLLDQLVQELLVRLYLVADEQAVLGAAYLRDAAFLADANDPKARSSGRVD